EETAPRLFSRLAAAITALIADPGFQLSPEGYDQLAVEHATFSGIFSASVFENSDTLLQQLSSAVSGNPLKREFTGTQNVVKLLMAYSLESELDIDFEAIFRAAPRLALPAFLAMLATRTVMSPAAHRRREKLLTLGPLFEQVEISDGMLLAISDAYMYCSYATSDTKHHIKRSFNKMLRRRMESLVGLPQFPAKRELKKKPVIMVPIEWFASHHAMYRCYAPSIGRLREHFKLVMIGRDKEMDAKAKELFDEVIEFKEQKLSVSWCVDQIRAVAPDIIYFPSVGMAPWCVALSTVRLAPIQVATLGHPASTQSEAIDYIVIPSSCPSVPACFTETVVLWEGLGPMVMRSDAEFPASAKQTAEGVVRVAVPSMVCKVTAPFLAMCRRISTLSKSPLEFHFFPNMVGLAWYETTKHIRKWLPGAVVHLRTGYNDYLQRVSRCHIHLSTFPFGGTNSNLDSMRLGIPMVSMHGREVHGQLDAAMMRHAQMPDSLIANSVEEYERIVLRLVANVDEREKLAKQLREYDIERAFLDQAGHPYAEDFLHLFRWIYAMHERIQSSGRRYWTLDDRRQAFPESAR
ncbi:MAG: hypothetical protein AB1762_20555, partial [Gemmatimonadota bacterium]